MSSPQAQVEAPIGRGPGAVTIRPRLAFWLGWGAALVTIVVFVVIAVILRNTATGVFFRVADQVAMVLLGVFVAGGLALFARPRVRADERGIEVRNVGLAKTLPWSAVERVAFPDGASWARLDLPDYEYLPVLAIQAADRQHAVDAIRRVRALYTAAHD